MESRKDLAAEKKRCGSHNCAQSVLAPSDLTGLDEKDHQARRQLFRSGHGQRRRYLRIYRGRRHRLWTDRERPGQGREGHEADHGEFQERNGATRCKLLKGVGTGVVLRECPMCVSDASEFWRSCWRREA